MKRPYRKTGWGIGEEAESNRVYQTSVKCVRPGCGHTADEHEFIDFGKEGKCEHAGCECHLFITELPVEKCWACNTPYTGDPLGVTEPACECGKVASNA